MLCSFNLPFRLIRLFGVMQFLRSYFFTLRTPVCDSVSVPHNKQFNSKLNSVAFDISFLLWCFYHILTNIRFSILRCAPSILILVQVNVHHLFLHYTVEFCSILFGVTLTYTSLSNRFFYKKHITRRRLLQTLHTNQRWSN